MSDTPSDFGDFDDDDALDHEPADPEQVARKLIALRRRLEHHDLPDWDELAKRDRDVWIAIAVALLAWMRRQGAH